MADFEIALDEQGNPVSELVRALAGRRLIVKEDDQRVHPFRSLALKGQGVGEALRRFLDELERFDRTADDGNSVPRLFEDLCYRLAELFEVYETIPSVVDLHVKKDDVTLFRAAIKRAVRDWNLLCNNVKHNSNAIGCLRYAFTPSNAVVTGFRLCRPQAGASLDVNKNFHRGAERMRSFIIGLHEMIHAVLRCDVLAAELVGKSKDAECEPIQDHVMSFDIGDSLKRISGRLVAALPQQSTMYDGFTLSQDALTLSRRQAIHINECATGTEQYNGDGFTKSFPFG